MHFTIQFIRQKGALFWILHILWSGLPLALACWVFTGLGFEVWFVGSFLLLVCGFQYHVRSSAVCSRAAFAHIGDARALMAEQRAIEMMTTLLSNDPAEARRDIRSTRKDLLDRFAAAAPYIRSAWLWSCVFPGLSATVVFAWCMWSWEADYAFSVPIAIIISFFLMTAQFLFRSPIMAAELFITEWEERQKK